MATIMYGQEGDDVIITRFDFGHGDEYLVEVRYLAGYYTVFSSFDYEKALKKAKSLAPRFDEESCDGECDYCTHKRTVPGTDERIDREPAYYCDKEA